MASSHPLFNSTQPPLICVKRRVYKRISIKWSSPTIPVKVIFEDYVFTARMSKLFAALVALSIAYSVQGCSDSCVGRPNGACFPSRCGCPNNYFVKCQSEVVVEQYCQASQCYLDGHCRPCGDSCVGKMDGVYPSLNRPRPAYYQCEAGQLYYRTCQSFQVFNPWTRKCECFEGACLHGNGWRSSFCRGKNWRVYCSGGFARYYRECPRPRPYVCCHTYTCVSSCTSYYGAGRCCRN